MLKYGENKQNIISPSKIILIGYSYGSIIASALAIEFPQVEKKK